MSKPLRVPMERLASGACRLTGSVARYVSRVHRLVPGDALSLFDPATGMEADARLVPGPPPDVWCEIDEPRPSGYRPLPIELLQGLGKADKPEEVIRAATALGVSAVTLIQSERSVARPSSDRSSSRLERWRRVAVEAARQCGRGDVPTLSPPRALGRVLPEIVAPYRIILAPGAEPLFGRLREWRGDRGLALLVGPEGGFDARELEGAAAAGFLPASLGSTTLRTELAGVAALGALVAFCADRAPS